MIGRSTMAIAVCCVALLAGGCQPPADPQSRDDAPSVDAAPKRPGRLRILRFVAHLDAQVPPPGPGELFRPRGIVTIERGNDQVLGGPAAYATTIIGAGPNPEVFKDKGAVIHFAGGDLRMSGIFPTRNVQTPIRGILRNVMVEEVTGGSGVFVGATGNVTLNSTLSGNDIDSTMTAVIFLGR